MTIKFTFFFLMLNHFKTYFVPHFKTYFVPHCTILFPRLVSTTSGFRR